MNFDESQSVIELAGNYMLAWATWEAQMREKVRRPWAIIGNQVVTQDVVFHDPDGMR